jgi:hypothetical protein
MRRRRCFSARDRSKRLRRVIIKGLFDGLNSEFIVLLPRQRAACVHVIRLLQPDVW